MKVDSNIKVTRPVNPKRRGNVGGVDFSELIDTGDGQAEEVNEVSGVFAMSPLLSIQEVGDNGSSPNKQFYERSTQMLDNLERLRLDLLAGSIKNQEMAELSRLLKIERPNITNPQLIDLLDEIELRVAVELAKVNISV